MSGYDYHAGMSNRAVSAYQSGIKPLSKITLADLHTAGWKGTVGLAKYLAKIDFWSSHEWHHSGGTWYNEVDFYDPEILVEFWAELSPEERKKYEDDFKASKSSKASVTYPRVKGEYAEFGGTGRRKKFLGNVKFTGTLKGDWIHLDDGRKKKASGNHITWTHINPFEGKEDWHVQSLINFYEEKGIFCAL